MIRRGHELSPAEKRERQLHRQRFQKKRRYMKASDSQLCIRRERAVRDIALIDEVLSERGRT